MDQRRETEVRPAFEIHLGETHVIGERIDTEGGIHNWGRLCIIWINGKRWEGILVDRSDLDQEEPKRIP